MGSRVADFTIVSMDGALALPALLSQAWVAFVIEFDNEFERRVPHRTTRAAATLQPKNLPWLVSMPLWTSVMRFVPREGISARELQQLSRIDRTDLRMWVTRLSKWWGYLAVERRAGDASAADALIRPTEGGRKAIDVWTLLTALIEERWRERFGANAIRKLSAALCEVIAQFDVALPGCLPVLHYEMWSQAPAPPTRAAAPGEHTLPEHLAKVLLQFATEFERESKLPIALSANVLRVAEKPGTPLRDLPRMCGISKEAVAMSVRRMEELALGQVQPSSTGRGKALVLTPQGKQAQQKTQELITEIEARWALRYGKRNIATLRKALEYLHLPRPNGLSPLHEGIVPYPEGWRAKRPKPDVLPHFPMVLHRGAFPDGS